MVTRSLKELVVIFKTQHRKGVMAKVVEKVGATVPPLSAWVGVAPCFSTTPVSNVGRNFGFE